MRALCWPTTRVRVPQPHDLRCLWRHDAEGAGRAAAGARCTVGGPNDHGSAEPVSCCGRSGGGRVLAEVQAPTMQLMAFNGTALYRV